MKTPKTTKKKAPRKLKGRSAVAAAPSGSGVATGLLTSHQFARFLLRLPEKPIFVPHATAWVEDADGNQPLLSPSIIKIKAGPEDDQYEAIMIDGKLDRQNVDLCRTKND